MKLKFLFIFAIILLVSSKHSLKSKKTSTKIENTVEKTQGKEDDWELLDSLTPEEKAIVEKRKKEAEANPPKKVPEAKTPEKQNTAWAAEFATWREIYLYVLLSSTVPIAKNLPANPPQPKFEVFAKEILGRKELIGFRFTDESTNKYGFNDYYLNVVDMQSFDSSFIDFRLVKNCEFKKLESKTFTGERFLFHTLPFEGKSHELFKILYWFPWGTTFLNGIPVEKLPYFYETVCKQRHQRLGRLFKQFELESLKLTNLYKGENEDLIASKKNTYIDVGLSTKNFNEASERLDEGNKKKKIKELEFHTAQKILKDVIESKMKGIKLDEIEVRFESYRKKILEKKIEFEKMVVPAKKLINDAYTKVIEDLPGKYSEDLSQIRINNEGSSGNLIHLIETMD